MEATLAFFLESPSSRLVVGWRRLSPKALAVTIWLVAGASNLSAYWILAANSFMQHPVGYAIRGGRAELTDFLAVITQKWALLEFTHTLAGPTTGRLLRAGVAAWHLARRSHAALFAKAFRLAAPWSLVFAVATGITGDSAARRWRRAAHQAGGHGVHWETRKGAPLYLLLCPTRPAGQRGPGPGSARGLSFLAFHDFAAEVKGLKDFPPADRPPVMLTFLGFRLMVAWAPLHPGGDLGHLAAAGAGSQPPPARAPALVHPLPYLALQPGGR